MLAQAKVLPPELISARYVALNREMHDNPGYGVMGKRYADIVRGLCGKYGTRDVLDYGCGKRTMEQALGFPIHNYDPALPGFDASPDPAAIVCCTDVLEHIEPECLDAVLDDIRRCTERVFLAVIATRPALKLLPDGTNPHKLVAPWEWWHGRLSQHWRMTSFMDLDKYFIWIGTPQ